MVLATKVSTEAFAEFRKCCLPKDITDYSYKQVVAKLRLLLSKQRSVFADRYECMHLTRDEGKSSCIWSIDAKEQDKFQVRRAN
jgi:hypothetical protein